MNNLPTYYQPDEVLKKRQGDKSHKAAIDVNKPIGKLSMRIAMNRPATRTKHYPRKARKQSVSLEYARSRAIRHY